MSKFIVALTLPEFGSTPNSPSANFYKYYLRNHWLKVLNSSGVQKDVVLDRPLDGFVADNPPCLPITANDTVLTAFEKFQCIMDNLAIITGSMKAATPWTAEHTTTNNDQYQVGTIVYYMNSVYKCIASNDSIIPTNATYWQYLGVASGYYTQEQADWNATTGSSFIRNKPTIPPAPVQPDWLQTNTSALDYIKNKPTNFGFDPVACNAKIITNQLDSCDSPSAPLKIQETNNAPVTLHGQNIGKGPGLIVSNTVHGYQALNANTTGSNSVSVGYQSLKANTTGADNTAVGAFSLITNITGNDNTALGYQALKNNTASSNIAIGSQALYTNSTASNNLAIGYNAMFLNSIGVNCVGIGNSSLYQSTGDNNTAVGHNALTKTTAYENTAIGSLAGYNITTGHYNIAIGNDALNAYTGTVACTGSSNIAIGKFSLALNTIGYSNIAIGINVLRNNIEGAENVSIGHQSGYYTTGGGNTFVGVRSGYGAVGTTSISNVAIGCDSLSTVTTGRENTVVGTNGAITLTTAQYSVAIGSDAMYVSGRPGSITGYHNIAIGGKGALPRITSGENNIGIGSNVLSQTTTGSNNLAVGINAGELCTGDNNIFIGPNAGANQTSSSYKIIVDNRSRGSAANEDALAPLVMQTAVTAEDQVVTLNAVLKLKPLSGAPSSPTEGMIYYHSGNHKLYCWDGSSWNALF